MFGRIGNAEGSVNADAAQCPRRQELAGRDAGHRIVPADIIEGLDRRNRRELETEARFSRALLQHEVPARIAARSFHFVDGEIEAEEEDVIGRMRLIERRARLRPRRVLLLRRREPIRFAQVARSSWRACAKITVLGYFLSSSPRMMSTACGSAGCPGRNAIVVVTQRRSRRPAMDLRNVVELFFQCILTQTFAVDGVAHRPELPEVAAALIGRVLAPKQLARKFVVEPDHIGFDEALVGFHQRDAVARDLVDVGQEDVRPTLLESG